MTPTATEADTAWWALLERCQGNVERAKGFWYRSRDLMALAPHPPTAEGLEEYRNEEDLEHQIIKALTGRGCLAYHSAAESKSRNRRALAGRAPVGWPDVTCLVPGGRILFLEVKTKDGSVSGAQLAMHARLGGLGHSVHVVRSVAEALRWLDAGKGEL